MAGATLESEMALNDALFTFALPFEPETLDTLSLSDLDVKLQRSYDQSLAGEGRPYCEVLDELERSIDATL